MFRVKQQSVIITVSAFVLILILSGLFSRSEPPMGLWVAFVVVALIVANLLGILAVQLHRLEAEAVTDHLTGAFNRRFFEKRLRQEIKRSDRIQRPMALLFMDIDNFKAFNDKFGHAAGDRALCWIVDSISECIREMDMIARHGGEEFVILLPEADIGDAATVAERARQLIQRESPRELGLGGGGLTVTIGVATYRFGESGASFVQRADEAMYEGKARGKNQTSLDRHDARGSVLITGKEGEGLERLARSLLSNGYHVARAHSAQQISHLASCGHYDLLICDDQPPDESIFRVVENFRAHNTETPVIVFAPQLTSDERSALQTLGQVEILPAAPETYDLRDLVSRAIIRSRTAVH